MSTLRLPLSGYLCCLGVVPGCDVTCVGPLTETFLHVSHTTSRCSQLLCLRYWLRPLGFLGYCGFSSTHQCRVTMFGLWWFGWFLWEWRCPHNIIYQAAWCWLCLFIHSFSDFQHLYKIRLLSESQSVIFVTQHILNALDASVRGRVSSCQQRFLKFWVGGTCVFVWSHSCSHSYLPIRSDPLYSKS